MLFDGCRNNGNLHLADICLPDASFLNNVSSLRLLGVIFSSDVSWNLHVESIVLKATKRLYIMYNLRRSGCPAGLMYKSYVAFIRSLLLFLILFL